jgi:glycosyltransferase involved in cell wall biosynthesis
VDDGSTDETARELEHRFSSLEWAKIIRHESNRGVAAAIMTGIFAASRDIVLSMDADCTYDPTQLVALWTKMGDGMDMVTASPYHPRGEVEGVPRWRLALSRTASTAYSFLLRMPLHTYTSCFRLHRREPMLQIQLREDGFVGIAEMLWQLKRNGKNICESPARLTSRRVGYSKMKTIPVIASHLKLMTRIAMDRISKPGLYTPTSKRHDHFD